MNLRTVFRITCLACVAFAMTPTLPSRADTLYGQGIVTGSIFNTTTRQHLQSTFSGSGVVRPGGYRGTANGSVTSLFGQRRPQPSILGYYRVLVRANARWAGGSTSISRIVTIFVGRRNVSLGGYGQVILTRPLNTTLKGRQTFRGLINVTIPGL